MAYAEIYRDGKLLSKEYFLSLFLFIDNDNSQEMTWETDVSPKKGAGVIIIWVQSAEVNPNISFVRPDCELSIDGILYERKFYTDVSDIKQKRVEISYKNYRLRFEFI